MVIDLKSIEVQASGGSNPPLSAIIYTFCGLALRGRVFYAAMLILLNLLSLQNVFLRNFVTYKMLI